MYECFQFVLLCIFLKIPRIKKKIFLDALMNIRFGFGQRELQKKEAENFLFLVR